MLRFIYLSALLLVTGPLAAQSEHADWVRQHSVAVATNAAATDSFADLEPLAAILAGVRVVHLGELSHGEGNGSAFRARLIRFLHQRLGFNVVVWEAGFYECHLMNELLDDNASVDRVGSTCLWPFWADNSEIRSLLEYARAGPLAPAAADHQAQRSSRRNRVSCGVAGHL